MSPDERTGAAAARPSLMSFRRPITRAAALLLVGAEIAVFGMLAAEAYSLGHEIASLRQRLAATELAAREAALRDECDDAIWPNIPLRCLERVTGPRGLR